MIGEQGQFWWLSGPNSIFTLFFKIIKKKDYFYKWLLPPMQLACLWVVGNELQIRALWKSLLVKSRQIVFWWWWWWWGCCCCWHSLLKTQHVPGICPKWFMTVKPWERQTECVCVRECVCTWLCPTICDPMDRSPPGSSVHGISQARILEVAISCSMGSSQPKDRTHLSFIGRWILYQ